MKQHSKSLQAIIDQIREDNPVPRKVRGGRRGKISRRHHDHPSHRKEARYLIQVRLRLGIAMLRNRGYDVGQISRILGVSRKTIEARMDDSLQALQKFDEEQERLRSGERFEEDLPGPAYTDPTIPADIPLVSGEILPNPDEYQLGKDAFELRTRAIPYHEIATLLGVSESEARNAVKKRLHFLEQDEMTETSLARRLQLEQIDVMMRGIWEDATQHDRDRGVTFSAIDRMVKLMDMKSKLLGLNAPQRVDIEERLTIIAKENNYDVEELKEIAAEVVAARSDRALR